MAQSRILYALCALSLLSPGLRAAVITTNTTVDLPFAAGGGFPVFLNSFNSALGTLDSVQLILTIEVTSSTLVTNETFTPDLLGEPIFTGLPGTIFAANVIMLNAAGLPILSTNLESPQTPFFLAPQQSSLESTVAVSPVNVLNVPTYELSAFTKPGFAALAFSAQQFVVLTTQPIGSLGVVVQGPNLGNFRASIQAIYTYTPFVGATLTPEPATLGLLALLGAGLLTLRFLLK